MRLETKNKAFTLIELLVVIAIIALLASIVLIALNGARLKSRDAKRVGDFHQLQNAFELYYDSNNGSYPTAAAGCDSSAGGCWTTLLSTTYVGKMPTDPLNTTNAYGYYYYSGDTPSGLCGYTAPGGTNHYILATRLENPTSIPNSCAGTFSAGTFNTQANYIVGK